MGWSLTHDWEIRSNSSSLLASLRSKSPNGLFQRWNVTSEMFYCRHKSTVLCTPAVRPRRIPTLSTELECVPFMAQDHCVGPDLLIKRLDAGLSSCTPTVLAGRLCNASFDDGLDRPGGDKQRAEPEYPGCIRQ